MVHTGFLLAVVFWGTAGDLPEPVAHFMIIPQDMHLLSMIRVLQEIQAWLVGLCRGLVQLVIVGNAWHFSCWHVL